MVGILIFGVEIPLWAILLIGLLIVVIAWRLVKFALKILLLAVVIFLIIMAIDYFGLLNWI